MRKMIIILDIAAILLAWFVIYAIMQGWVGITTDARLRDRYKGDIARVTSSTDKDHDGIDDQTDILQSALAYVAKKPEYKSKYYDGGYPDDGYGVCTDVVAQGLLGAGYDLQKLVDADIRADMGAYRLDRADPNIDFRRVRNLKVFFAHTAISLTTDVNEIEEWQGGDIVVFEKHVGIVSDRRNAKGVPYVIHHYGPMQRRYEEDILERRTDIVGHFRISD